MTSDPEDRDDADEDSTGTQLDLLEAASNAASYRPTAAAYSRGPNTTTVTDGIEELLTHARDALGYDLTNERVTDLADAPNTWEHGAGANPTNDQDGAVVTYDLGDAHPAGVDQLLDAVTEHDVEDVFAPSLVAFGGVDEATRTVERLQDEGATVHLIEDDLVIEPGDEHARKLLTAARRANNRVDRTDTSSQLVTEGTGTKWTGGQPPAGFTVSSTGHLQRSEDWETIRRAAAAVENNDLTLYRAAKLIGHSRHAIRTAMNKYRDLYRVDEADPLPINSDADDEQ